MRDVKTMSRLATVVQFVDPTANDAPLEVVIDRGIEQGLKLGDRFLVFGRGPHIVDPHSGRDLGPLELVRGQGEVVQLQERMATIHTTGRRRAYPARGIVSTNGVARFVPLHVGTVVVEDITVETEIPFEAVRLGDHAKPI